MSDAEYMDNEEFVRILLDDALAGDEEKQLPKLKECYEHGLKEMGIPEVAYMPFQDLYNAVKSGIGADAREVLLKVASAGAVDLWIRMVPDAVIIKDHESELTDE